MVLSKLSLLTCSLLLSWSAFGQDCPITPKRNCLDPIENIGGDGSCLCFSCGSEDGERWMLCTTDEELATLVKQRAEIGKGIAGNEIEAGTYNPQGIEWDRSPQDGAKLDLDGQPVPVHDTSDSAEDAMEKAESLMQKAEVLMEKAESLSQPSDEQVEEGGGNG